MFETPILFLIFNRPEHTRKVFERIREIRPKFLFVAADGPRKGNTHDEINCKLARAIITDGIDWPCELNTLFREENLGCGLSPAGGITWFFNHVEQGIILEDDCLPSRCFFPFCSLLLTRYKEDGQIMAISGSNYLGNYRESDFDYFFSDGGNWGWASWRRAWKLFDYALKTWPSASKERKKLVTDYYPNFEEQYLKLSNGQDHIWDLQWHYARLFNCGLSITPSKNLISNIGFDSLATHTLDEGDPFSKTPVYEIEITNNLRGTKKKEIDLVYRRRMIQMSQGISLRNRILSKLRRLTLR